MEKTIIPIGFVIDKDNLIEGEKECYAEVLGLMGFDTATGKYVNCGRHRYDDRVIFPLALDISLNRVYFKWDSRENRYIPSYFYFYEGNQVAILDNNCPLFHTDGTYIDCYESKTIYFHTPYIAVEFNVETLSYSVDTSGSIKHPDLLAVDTFGCDTQDIACLLDEVFNNIYYLDGVCIVTRDFVGDTLILPHGTKYLFIYGDASNITSLVCSKELLEMYCIDSNGIGRLKRLAISKSITKEQFAKITYLIMKFNYKDLRDLSYYYHSQDWDGFYEYATKNSWAIASAYEDIEIIVY
jgi:hypothetical protein